MKIVFGGSDKRRNWFVLELQRLVDELFKISLGVTLLFGQNRRFEDITLVSGLFFNFILTFYTSKNE